MATARKCDRCGKYYDKNSRYRIALSIATADSYEDFDLCDECIGELRKFIGVKEEKDKFEELKKYLDVEEEERECGC